MIIEIQPLLYRYDLVEPPNEWSKSHKSIEKNYYNESEHKNKADLFFFTDSLAIAKDLGKNAAINNDKVIYFLTSLNEFNSTIKIIDFSDCYNIYQMLCLLSDINIDVLSNRFQTFEGTQTFESLKSIFESVESESDIDKKRKLFYQLKVHSSRSFDDISLFGQRLTDFENGIIFKDLVKLKYPDVDGYKWQEFKDKRGYTYCFFDCDKLPDKTTIKVEI